LWPAHLARDFRAGRPDHCFKVADSNKTPNTASQRRCIRRGARSLFSGVTDFSRASWGWRSPSRRSCR
jgi:hypothetical protein